jgi:hypothetical protein
LWGIILDFLDSIIIVFSSLYQQFSSTSLCLSLFSSCLGGFGFLRLSVSVQHHVVDASLNGLGFLVLCVILFVVVLGRLEIIIITRRIICVVSLRICVVELVLSFDGLVIFDPFGINKILECPFFISECLLCQHFVISGQKFLWSFLGYVVVRLSNLVVNLGLCYEGLSSSSLLLFSVSFHVLGILSHIKDGLVIFFLTFFDTSIEFIILLSSIEGVPFVINLLLSILGLAVEFVEWFLEG